MTNEEAGAYVEQIAAALGEHFEAVQIMVSTHTPEGTIAIRRGVGNWFARQGMAHEFIGISRAVELGEAVAREIRGDE